MALFHVWEPQPNDRPGTVEQREDGKSLYRRSRGTASRMAGVFGDPPVACTWEPRNRRLAGPGRLNEEALLGRLGSGARPKRGATGDGARGAGTGLPLLLPVRGGVDLARRRAAGRAARPIFGGGPGVGVRTPKAPPGPPCATETRASVQKGLRGLPGPPSRPSSSFRAGKRGWCIPDGGGKRGGLRASCGHSRCGYGRRAQCLWWR